MNVLFWITRPGKKYKPYVANRVGEIQTKTTADQWRHVPTKKNPADKASRRAMGAQSWTDELTTEEFKEAEDCLVRQAQKEDFQEEINSMSSGIKTVKKSSPLASLSPFFDETRQLLRLRSRLEKVEYLNDDEKYPVFLPRKGDVTRLVVQRAHDKIGHPVEREATIHKIRQNYWILRNREAVNDGGRKCSTCILKKAKPQNQQMAPIPKFRLQPPLRAFSKCGIDFAGSYYTKQGRGKTQTKRYLAVFTCLQTGAIHLEPVYSMDTDGFLMAFSRMTSRRSVPEDVLTDNGSNFIAGERKLREFAVDWNKVQTTIAYQNKGLKWHFNPPATPHYGGVFEIMVKAAKRALKTIISRADINDEEFHTFVVEAEGQINSRPLTPPSSDPNDDLPLTPNHFLHGQLGGQLAPSAVDEQQRINPRRRWQRVQELLRHFWARWKNELLPLLHNRKKWLYETKNLQNDSLCILVDEKLPHGQWRLAKVVETYPGSDGLMSSQKAFDQKMPPHAHVQSLINQIQKLRKRIVAHPSSLCHRKKMKLDPTIATPSTSAASIWNSDLDDTILNKSLVLALSQSPQKSDTYFPLAPGADTTSSKPVGKCDKTTTPAAENKLSVENKSTTPAAQNKPPVENKSTTPAVENNLPTPAQAAAPIQSKLEEAMQLVSEDDPQA
ncbi:uncharacterized protein LOC135493621 [Lineus longissimus]|uniref:uncharacterized protein LOC135493621 n=1 Tax=Lineus longissimus TaxID=88925 RepID=UPI00315CF998